MKEFIDAKNLYTRIFYALTMSLSCSNFFVYFQFDSFGVNRTVNLTYFHYQVNYNCIYYLRIEIVEIMVNRVNLIGYEEGQVDSMAFQCEELSSRFWDYKSKGLFAF